MEITIYLFIYNYNYNKRSARRARGGVSEEGVSEVVALRKSG